MQEDLVSFYRQQCYTLPLSPLMEENDTPILEFYVKPDINSVETVRLWGGGKEVRSKVTSLHDVFYKENELCREIYLIADSGFGKTAFSKRLVLAWCQAKKHIQDEEEYFDEEAIATMSEFDLVFFLSLHDCSLKQYDIDDMILKQIIQALAHTSLTMNELENLLSRVKYLVILDGLDEWTHPLPVNKQGHSDIPHRKARECTILTTSRPWKFGISKIRSSEIERKLELVGLCKESAKSLKKSVISLLCGKTDVEKNVHDFDLAVSDRGISDWETTPLLLTYLLCLWCDVKDLGRSRTELYCQIVELLLKHTFGKYPEMQQSHEHSPSYIPQCFSKHEHCTKYSIYLKDLAQLAFGTLFSETKESTLVFLKSVADKYLSKDSLKLSLHLGLLTQSTEKTLTKQTSKVSFAHKTVQEFFCALYICCQNESDVKNIVQKYCKSLQSILDMSTVFAFISGMNADIISSISHQFMSVIREDEITSEYRSTTDRDCEPLKDIQDMYISCLKENTSSKELKLFCQDFFVSYDCQEEKYFPYLTRLVKNNQNNMESVNIDTEDGHSLHEIINNSFAVNELFSINKIFYCSEDENTHLPVLLYRSPKCVTVMSSGTWSREIPETLQNNSLLQAIHICNCEMSHDVLNDFLNYIMNRKTMTEIRLELVLCTEHDDSCTFNLDFCHHSDLRKLELCMIPKVSQLTVNSQVKKVKLFGNINLDERSLPPEMVNIELVELWDVNISASAFRLLVKAVEKLSHKVTVKINCCNIAPRTEFEDVKQYIRLSQNFRVVENERRRFEFETKVES
ncbi:uncharacterized protein LOC123546711 isoform X2 [Mercenaria mercenaria]|nr:uncharacterized protein LOC123546711 isoform X2 [Mercenaria mercenaria]